MAETEGGIRPQRLEFVRVSPGTTAFPSNPAYEPFSDNIESTSWDPTVGPQERRGIGSHEPTTFHSGPEEHSFEVVYDLQRALLSGGSPQDPAADGLERDTDNAYKNVHNILAREEVNSVPAGQTVSGSTSRDTRLYLVVKHAGPGEGSLEGDPGSQQPILTTIGYTARKVREYRIDQPTSGEGATELVVVSTDAGDTTQTLTVENEGAGTTEDVSLNGTTDVSTTETFSDVDALHLDAETAGDVEVYINTGTSTAPVQGDKIAVISGQDSYDHGEGDLGVPSLGTGSHAATIGTAYETILDDTITRGGSDIAYEVNSISLSWENDHRSEPQIGTPQMSMQAQNQTVTLEANIAGPTQSIQHAEEALQNVASDIVWTLTGGTITLGNARLTDLGSIDAETGQAARALGNTFQAESTTLA